jgi:SET domain
MAVKIKVKSLNSFNTVVAKSKIARGEIITPLTGEAAPGASKYSIQISQTEHVLPYSPDPEDPTSFWRFLNHSCTPNSFIDVQKMALVALGAVAEGDEVRINYNTTEFEIASPFSCNCGALNCDGEIKGYRHLSRAKQQILNPYLAPYLKKNSVQSLSL